jgi:hypothetical protein
MLAAGEEVTNARDTANNITELTAINHGQRNYEKYPDTGRPPERWADIPAQRTSEPKIVNVTVNPPADIDVYALSRMVSRQIMLEGK